MSNSNPLTSRSTQATGLKSKCPEKGFQTRDATQNTNPSTANHCAVRQCPNTSARYAGTDSKATKVHTTHQEFNGGPETSTGAGSHQISLASHSVVHVSHVTSTAPRSSSASATSRNARTTSPHA
ncbi:MAG: hypothetical protein LC799_06055, partial [Actinobacteria bacterium]|nr:hypothetical protein [Actinomycetota bacterium]